MKAKSLQAPSELEAKEKLIVYVFEYLNHVGANKAAELFLEEIRYDKAIKLMNNDDKNAFLSNWWFVFWDLYCAAPEKRVNQPEPTIEGRTFYDFHIRNSMSPNIMQTSPPQQHQHHPHHHQQPPPPGSLPPPHYGMGPGGPPPPGPPGPPGLSMYGGPPGPLPMGMGHGGAPGAPGPPHPHMRPMGSGRMPQGQPRVPPPPHFMGGNPRYAPVPPQMHPPPHNMPPSMQGSSPVSNSMIGMGPVSVPEPCGPSPGVSRMTPVGGGGPMMSQMAPGPSPSGSGSGGQMMQQQQPPPSNMGMQGLGPSPQGRPMSQQQQQQQSGWLGNVNYGVGSPAGQQQQQQQIYIQQGGPPSIQGNPNQGGPDMSGMLMSDRVGGGAIMDMKNSPVNNGGAPTPHPDDFLMPNFGSSQEADQNETAEIMKVKQSLQEEAKKYDDAKPDFNMDYQDSQNKWSNM